MTELSLEQRICRLEWAEEIRAMKAAYCDLCDRGYDPDGLAALFTEDAVWDGGIFGRHEGREAIRSFFRSISGSLVFAAHLVTNPVIDFVDDDTAHGRWRLLEPATVSGPEGPEARLLLGSYRDVYVRRNGRWLLQSVGVHVNFFVPLHEGWAVSAVA